MATQTNRADDGPRSIAKLITWHRRLALCSVIFLLGSSISGISRTADKAIPAPSLPRGPQTQFHDSPISLSAAEAATRLPAGSQIVAAECRIIDGAAWWQFVLKATKPIPCPPGQFGPPLMVQPEPVYVHAQTGAIADKELDKQYALAIAETVLQQTALINKQLLGFSPSYAIIERLRPVYRISPSDDVSESVFISTHQGAAVSWINTRRSIDKTLFTVLHKYFFIRNRAWREGLQIGINVLMCLAACSGLLLWLRLRRIRPAPSRVRRLHSRVGLVAFIAVILGAGSGVLHTSMVLLSDSPPPPQPQLAPQVMQASAVPQPPPNAVAIAVCQVNNTTTYQYRYVDEQTSDYYNAQTHTPITDGDLIYAQAIAANAIGQGGRFIQRKQEFDLDYGRINRFLPVSEFAATDAKHLGKHVHVSTVTGSITRSTSAWDRSQIRLFSWLHSLSWIPEPFRTIALITMGLAICVSSLLGLFLFFPLRFLKCR